MFRPNRAIIRPNIWTGSFDYSTFWDPKTVYKMALQCCVLNDYIKIKTDVKRQMSIKKIVFILFKPTHALFLKHIHLHI